jgi:hypothetical protein
MALAQSMYTVVTRCINHWVDGYTLQINYVAIGQRTTNKKLATSMSYKPVALFDVYPLTLSDSQ